MADPESTVYLEDIDTTYSSKRARPNDLNEDGEGPAATAAPPIGAKRQRTLADMFSGSQGKKPAATSPSSPAIKPAARVASSSGSRSGMQKLNAIPFSLSSYQGSLTEEQRRLLQLECDAMGKSWLKVLKDEIKKPYFLSLKEFLWNEGIRATDTPASLRIYPPAKDIYSWSNSTPLGKVKVVILGQDPYHGRGQAHGLCFSVPVGVTVPPSLRNIYAEIKAEYPTFEVPQHGQVLHVPQIGVLTYWTFRYLGSWANNGVLMLNACLTVREGDANSHADKGWEQFTDCVINMVDKYGGANLPSGSSGGGSGFGRGVVFLAWGAYAGKRVARLNKTKHLILTSAHPSPFSANKGFLGNGHFKSANSWLERKYGPEGRVDWCKLESEPAL